jgi:hypothetical protein
MECTSRPTISGATMMVIKQGPTSVLGHRSSPQHCHTAPPHRLQRLVWVIVLNPREGDVALAVPRERRFGFGRRSVTPPDQQAASTLEGLPSHDTLPSPLPSPQRSVYHPTTPGSSCGCCVTRRW